MRKLKLFIVEDNRKSLKRLITLLQPYDSLIDFKSLVTATSFIEAQECLLTAEGFDVSILDKNLDEGEVCFSLIKETNKVKFGIRVFNTIDFDNQELMKIMEISGDHLVLRKPYTAKGLSTLMSQIVELKSRDESATIANNFLTIRVDSTHFFLRKELIVAIVGKANDATIHYMSDGGVVEYKVSGQMKDYLPRLSAKDFQEIKYGTLINIQFITTVNKSERTLYLKGIRDPFTVTDSYIPLLRQRFLWP